MGRRRKRKPGPQRHAEGQHGEGTHARLVEQLQQSPPEEPVESRVERKHVDAAYEGRRRLVEDRQQHDEAAKNSERTRLFDEYTRRHTTARGRATTARASTACSATANIERTTRPEGATDCGRRSEPLAALRLDLVPLRAHEV